MVSLRERAWLGLAWPGGVVAVDLCRIILLVQVVCDVAVCMRACVCVCCVFSVWRRSRTHDVAAVVMVMMVLPVILHDCDLKLSFQHAMACDANTRARAGEACSSAGGGGGGGGSAGTKLDLRRYYATLLLRRVVVGRRLRHCSYVLPLVGILHFVEDSGHVQNIVRVRVVVAVVAMIVGLGLGLGLDLLSLALGRRLFRRRDIVRHVMHGAACL